MAKKEMNFIKSAIEKLKPSPDGRYIVKDSQTRGLILRVSPNGVKRFYFYRKVQGRPVKKLIGLFPDKSIEKARGAAGAYNAMIAEGMDIQTPAGETGLTVAEAAQEAIGASNASPDTKRSYLYFFNQFDEWRRKAAPRVRLWTDMKSQLLVRYIEHSRSLGLAYDTVRLRFAVLRATSRHMAIIHKADDIALGIRVVKRGSQRAPRKKEEEILAPDQLRRLLDWLSNQDPMLHVWAVLGGLTGMRMQEYVYLRADDIDLNAGTITIQENEAHTPKTPASYRTIPICAFVIETLREWIDAQTLILPSGFLFPSVRQGGKAGQSALAQLGCYTKDGLIARWGRRLKVARKFGEIDLPPRFTARLLRGCFVSSIRNLGGDPDDLRAYVGQAPTSVLSAHYDAPSMERLRAIADLAETIATDKTEHPEANIIEAAGNE